MGMRLPSGFPPVKLDNPSRSPGGLARDEALHEFPLPPPGSSPAPIHPQAPLCLWEVLTGLEHT